MTTLLVSIDDGYPVDLILAESLARLDIRATFFIPRKNCEGLKVLRPSEIKEINAMGHEIGSHTFNHRYLDALPMPEAKVEILDGRKYLEDILGKSV